MSGKWTLGEAAPSGSWRLTRWQEAVLLHSVFVRRFKEKTAGAGMFLWEDCAIRLAMVMELAKS